MLQAATWLLGLLPLAAIGGPLLLHPAYRALPVGARIVLSGAVGAVLVSWLMVLSSWTTLSWNLWLLALAGFACAALLRLTLPRGSIDRRNPRAAPPDSSSLLGRLAAAAAIVCAALCTAAGKTGSPDMLYHWGVKGERFALAGRIDVAFLKQPLLDYMVPSYPPLLPNLYAWTTLATGRFSWDGLPWFFPFFLLLTWIAVRGVLVADVEGRAADSIAALLVAAIAVIGVAAIFGGIGEMPLLFFEVAGVALLSSRLSREPAIQLLAGLCLAAAASTKVEGLAVAIPAIAAFAVGERGHRRLGPLLRTAAPVAVAVGTWLAFGRTSGLFEEYVGYGPLLRLHPSRIPEILATAGRALFSIDAGAPYVVPLLCLLLVRGRLRAMAIPVTCAVTLILFLVFTYLHGELDPGEWIGWTAARVFSPVAALLALALAQRFRRALPEAA